MATNLTDGSFTTSVIFANDLNWNNPMAGEIIRVGDVNGDGYSDMISHDTEGNTVLIINRGRKCI